MSLLSFRPRYKHKNVCRIAISASRVFIGLSNSSASFGIGHKRNPFSYGARSSGHAVILLVSFRDTIRGTVKGIPRVEAPPLQ